MSDKFKRPGIITRTTQYNNRLCARNKVIAKGQDPIDMLYEVYNEAMEGYRSGRGVSEKGDNGAAYLGAAFSAAAQIARFVYPTISASAVKIDDGTTEKRQLDMKEAISIIAEDPFAKAAIHAMQFQKEVTSEDIETSKITIDLPKGNK